MTEIASRDVSSPATEQTAPNGAGPTCHIFRNGRPAETLTDLSRISEILDEPGTLVWFDVVDPDESDLALLQQEFELHPLAVEDALNAHQRPKIEEYGSYWFIVIWATTLKGREITFHEVAIFAGEKYLVTVRHDPPYSLDEILSRWRAHPERLRQGAGFLLYTILDTIVDGYIPVAEMFQERVDELEEPLFEERGLPRDIMQEIFALKRVAQHFRHSVIPVRDILNPIIREDIHLYPEEEVVYFRDIYDHVARLSDQLDSARDLLGSALEIHLSVVANRQNEVMKQLAFVATIFLPLSFVVGFFGQNFSFLVNHIQGAGSFLLLGLLLEILVVAATVGYFRYNRWF